MMPNRVKFCLLYPLISLVSISCSLKYTFSTPENVDLELLKAAAHVTGNVFTQDFSLVLKGDKLNSVVFSVVSKYSGEDAPTIKLYPKNHSDDFPSFYIGGMDSFEKNEWRMVPFLIGDGLITIAFTIPIGTTLTIDSFSRSIEDELPTRTDFPMALFEHSGFWGGDFNTSLAFELASIGGYYGAIVVPKRTSDGVWVCFHDDSGISNRLQYKNGEPVSQDKISDCSYKDIQEMEYISTNILGEHSLIPKLEEFFAVCEKTGLHPCFSCHPVPSARELEEIKVLLNRYNLLTKFNIKAPFSTNYLMRFHDVFGDSLESVLMDVNASFTTQELLEALDNSGFDKDKVKLGLEFFTKYYDERIVSILIENGYYVGVYNDDPSAEELNSYVESGVWEIAVRNHFSGGLNW